MTDLSFITYPRARGALKKAGITTLEAALAAGEEALCKIPFVTPATWEEIIAESHAQAELAEDAAAFDEAVERVMVGEAMDLLARDADTLGYTQPVPSQLLVALTEAERSGPNSDAAVAAVEGLLDLQAEHGICRIDTEANHLPWAHIMARLLQIYRGAKPPSALFGRIGEWWNQAVALGVDPDVSAWINRSEMVANPSPAARIFYEMPDVPLPRPSKPYPVVG